MNLLKSYLLRISVFEVICFVAELKLYKTCFLRNPFTKDLAFKFYINFFTNNLEFIPVFHWTFDEFLFFYI